MSAIKEHLYNLREMWELVSDQDQHIKQLMLETEPDQWDGVETTYTQETNADTIKS